MNKKKIYICLEFFIFIWMLFVFCWPFKVYGESMENTLFTGDRIFVSRALVFFNQFERGDILVCKIPINGKEDYIIKRLIGFPNDTVLIKDGIVCINGKPLEEDYIKEQYTSGNVNIVLGENEYYMLGDNRTNNYDSRSFGALSRDRIVGKMIFTEYVRKSNKNH